MHDSEEIAGEILHMLGTLIAGCEALDAELAYGMFSRSRDFLMMNTDGSVCGFDTFFGNDATYLGGCVRFSLSTHATDIRVIDDNTAILAWSYKAEAELKSGEIEIVDNAGASFVFMRRDDAWTVEYYHQSSLPFRRVPAMA